MPLKQISFDSMNRFTLLVLGPAGIGKTSLLRTIPQNEKALVLSAEGGLLSVRDLVETGNVEGFEISSFSEMEEVLSLVRQDDYKKNFKWIFIDSLTEIASKCVESMQAKHRSASDTFKLWGEYNDLMTRLVKSFRDLDHYNVVFTCLTEIETDETKRRYYAPLIQGNNLKQRLISYFDYAFFMDRFVDNEAKESRMFITKPYQLYPAKSREWYFGQFEMSEIPDLTLIQSKIFNNHKKEKAA